MKSYIKCRAGDEYAQKITAALRICELATRAEKSGSHEDIAALELAVDDAQARGIKVEKVNRN